MANGNRYGELMRRVPEVRGRQGAPAMTGVTDTTFIPSISAGQGYGDVLPLPEWVAREQQMMEEMGMYPGLSPEEEAVIAEFQEIKLPNGGFRYLISKDNEGRFTITDRQFGTYASEKNTDTGLTLGELQDRLKRQ